MPFSNRTIKEFHNTRMGTQGTRVEIVIHNRHWFNSDTSQDRTCKRKNRFVNTGIKKNIFSNTTGKASRPAKRLRLEGAKPLNLMMVIHFQLFFQGPRAPKRDSKWNQNGASGHPKSQKIKKSGHSKQHRKTTLQKVGYWSKMTSKMDYFFAAETLSLIHISEPTRPY